MAYDVVFRPEDVHRCDRPDDPNLSVGTIIRCVGCGQHWVRKTYHDIRPGEGSWTTWEKCEAPKR